MKINKKINNAKYYLERLTDTAKRASSNDQKLFYKKMINSFIELVNISEALLEDKFKTDIIDSLLLALIRERLEFMDFRKNVLSDCFVFEKKDSNKLRFVGNFDFSDLEVCNYAIEISCGKIKGVKTFIKKRDAEKESVVFIPSGEVKKVVEFIENKKYNEIDIREVVRLVDVDLEYNSSLNKSKLIQFLKDKEADFLLQNPSVKIEAGKEYDELVDDLLNQFKENIEWNY